MISPAVSGKISSVLPRQAGRQSLQADPRVFHPTQPASIGRLGARCRIPGLLKAARVLCRRALDGDADPEAAFLGDAFLAADQPARVRYLQLRCPNSGVTVTGTGSSIWPS